MRLREMTALLVCGAMAMAAWGPLPAAAKDAPKAPAKAPAQDAPSVSAALMPAMALPGVPAWTPPPEYVVDLVMTNEGQSVTMKRSFGAAGIRTDMTSDDQTMVMLERAAEPGIMYMLNADEKMAIKMNLASMQEKAIAKETKPEPEVKPVIEKLGTEAVNGRNGLKYKITAEGNSVLAWFDAESGAPLRMKAEDAVIDWKNLEAKAQPAKLFEIPKGYEVMDLDEQMKQMEKMGGMKGMMGGIPGGVGGMMGGGARGMAGGMAQNYAGQMGSSMGQSIGAGIGASFGGPLGSMAGGYIGGAVGGWVGKKAAGAVTGGGR